MRYYKILAAHWYLSTIICVGMEQNRPTIRLIDVLNDAPQLNCRINYPGLKTMLITDGSSTKIKNAHDKKGRSVAVDLGPCVILKGTFSHKKQLLGYWGARIPLNNKNKPLLAFAGTPNLPLVFDTAIHNSEANALLIRAIRENW